LDRTDFFKRLEYHQKIWNAPHLLELLEKHSTSPFKLRPDFALLWNDSDFDEFLSPYLAAPFGNLSRNLLAEKSFGEMAELLCFEGFLLTTERDEAFKPLRLFLEEEARLLRNVHRENYGMLRDKIIHWIEGYWREFFNTLPREFYEIKIQIVTCLVNIGVEIQKERRKDCRSTSKQLAGLTDMPESLRQTILSNHAAYNSSRFQTRNRWWLAWIIFIFIRVVANNGCDSNSNSQFTDYTKYIDQFTIDSVIKLKPNLDSFRLLDTLAPLSESFKTILDRYERLKSDTMLIVPDTSSIEEFIEKSGIKTVLLHQKDTANKSTRVQEDSVLESSLPDSSSLQ
jgi:hypothetical protein